MPSSSLVVASSDPGLCEQFSSFFEDYQLEFAESAEEVELRLLGSRPPDALIWDLRMDGARPEEALGAIQRISPRLPVIVLGWRAQSAFGPHYIRVGNVHLALGPMSLGLVKTLAGFALAESRADGAPKPPAWSPERLARKEHLYSLIEAKSVFENLPLAGMVVGEDRVVLAINKRARQLAGASAGSVVGKKTCREVWKCRIPACQCPLDQALETRRTVRSRVGMSLAGEDRTCLEEVSPFRNPITGDREAAIMYVTAGA